jgi:transcriptional regulator with XRE-family HTH domain
MDYAERRRALGLQAGAVADALGVRREVYSRWERGREPWPPPRVKALEALLSEYERTRDRVAKRLAGLK